MACILLWSSAVRVQDSQAYRKMDVTREHISCILELREILLSFKTGFSLVTAAVVCAILESISVLEPSSVIHEDCLKLLSIYFDLCVDAAGVVCHHKKMKYKDTKILLCFSFMWKCWLQSYMWWWWFSVSLPSSIFFLSHSHFMVCILIDFAV